MSIYKKILSMRVLIAPFFLNGQTQLGSDIDGEALYDFFGYSVSINSTGNRVAIGGKGNDANGEDAGHARIYE